MTTITTIIISLIFLSIIIMVHELGHFLVSKMTGIYAQEFSIGMGPRLLKFSGKETQYSLRLFPIGGYVKFLGEDEDSNDPRAFNNADVWKRMAVVAAGPIMNFILAIILLSIIFMAFGIYTPAPIVNRVIKGSAAQEAGLKDGDRIIGINNIKIENMEDESAVENIRNFINKNGSKPISMNVIRNNKQIQVQVKPTYNEKENAYLIGIEFGFNIRRLDLFSAIGIATAKTGEMIILMLQALGNLLFRQQNFNQVMGPVGIVGEIGKAAKAGIQQLMYLGIIISINLGIINLIPFPALDGGRFFMLIIEGLRGKPFNREKEGYINLIGFVLLLLLMILVTFQDITR